jgi:dienelactone hydrolase
MAPSDAYAASLESVQAAAERIKDLVHHTPVGLPCHGVCMGAWAMLAPTHAPRFSCLICWYLQVLTSSSLDTLSGHQLHFKCEIFQKTGAFKYRVSQSQSGACACTAQPQHITSCRQQAS